MHLALRIEFINVIIMLLKKIIMEKKLKVFTNFSNAKEDNVS